MAPSLPAKGSTTESGAFAPETLFAPGIAPAGMEHMELAVATGGNPWQMGRPEKRLR
jgi:hypothetical protein